MRRGPRAHSVVAGLVASAIAKGKQLDELSLDEYRESSQLFEKDVLKINVESAIAARDIIGGTAPKQVERALRQARKILDEQ